MAATASSDVSEGPVLNLINKRLRALRKKLNRITQMEEAIAQGKPINKEQEEVLRSKPSVTALIDELEKLRQPLSQAVSEELTLATQRLHLSSDSAPGSTTDAAVADNHEKSTASSSSDQQHHRNDESDLGLVEDLLYLLYFGSLFDVKSQSDFTATMLTRTHERGCCLTYDYVTEDATDLLGERDLDSISALSGLLISRPVDSSLSHKNALTRCIEHAKLWLAKSDRPIEPNANITYSTLRERLNKIMASDYFITTPEMKATVDVAAGNYASFQVPITGPTQVEGSVAQFQHMDQEAGDFQGQEIDDDESSPVDELQKDEVETENAAEVQEEQTMSQAELEHNEIDPQSKAQQYIPRRNYPNQRGVRGGGGGRRGYSNGRGGRGGKCQGRGGRGGGQSYNNPGSAVQGGHAPADVGVRS
uniref:Glycine-rich protein n=1 Tax=Fagus sylvatica TaxID=28930 RepID=A0A2N9EBJ5_FAGSY